MPHTNNFYFNPSKHVSKYSHACEDNKHSLKSDIIS